MSSDLNDKAVNTAREELQEARVRIEGLTYQLSALQKQVQIPSQNCRNYVLNQISGYSGLENHWCVKCLALHFIYAYINYT